jgi:hypothetical protein
MTAMGLKAPGPAARPRGKTPAILEATTDVHPLDAATLGKVHPALESPSGEQTLAALQGGNLPVISAGPALDPRVVAALEAAGAGAID